MANIINLNTAQPEELTTLPGIGPAMANRIITARPYETIDDLRVVSGVGPALIERLTPLVTLDESQGQDEDVIYLEAETEIIPQELEPDDESAQPDLEDFTPSKLKEGDESLDEKIKDTPSEAKKEWGDPEELSYREPESEDIIPKEKAIVPMDEEHKEKHKTKGRKPVTWGRALLVMLAFSLVSFLLAVLLTIGIIGTLNNGLRYVSPAELQSINNKANALETQLGTLLEDVEGMRSRLDNLEGIPAQIKELEANAEKLQGDMSSTLETVEGMHSQIEELQNNASRFQIFLDGLTELMLSLGSQTLETEP